jgi:hypothetical protein
MWKFLRIVFIALGVLEGGLLFPRIPSNACWIFFLPVGLFFSIILFICLKLQRHFKKEYVDWSEPYNWTKPFFPMHKYPLRFWFLGSLILSSIGFTVICGDLILQENKWSLGAVLLLTSLMLNISLKMSMKPARGNR